MLEKTQDAPIEDPTKEESVQESKRVKMESTASQSEFQSIGFKGVVSDPIVRNRFERLERLSKEFEDF